MNNKQIDKSLGRNCYSDPTNGKKVYISHVPGAYSFMTDSADVLSLDNAINLVERGLVWGMNCPAENALRDAVVVELKEAA